MLRVHSIETFGTHDGPGLRLVVFLQGCNIRCLYCHNPDLLDREGGKLMKRKEIIELAEKQKEYFGEEGGVTVSGGEPTLQPKGLNKLFRSLKRRGIKTALDTNGMITSDEVKKLYKKTDLLLLDVKHIDEKMHIKLTGASNRNVLEMAKYREDTGKPMWIRYVLVPGWNDEEKYLRLLGEYFKDYKTIEKLEILPYHTLGVYKYKELGMKYKLSKVNPPTSENIENARKILSEYFTEVVVK
ncbi:MAG: pyruvate formate-lyase-activating protein [Candidatus Shapirobacteria bacterium]|nr:pyruvate formate-lyase-activating protein [Candidatus Shapirobacteria bacterium]